MAKGMCIHARMRVKADEGWTDQHISAALSLLEEKSSLSAKAEKHVLCLLGFYQLSGAEWEKRSDGASAKTSHFSTCGAAGQRKLHGTPGNRRVGQQDSAGTYPPCQRRSRV